MKKLFFIAMVMSVIVSCSPEENLNDQSSFDVKTNYFKIIQSENPLNSLENFTDEQKAELWLFKYDLFIENNQLPNEQIKIINKIKVVAREMIVNDNYDEQELIRLDLEVSKNFSKSQYMDLFFYIDNPSLVITKGCFWCNEIINEGDCEIMETSPGVFELVREYTYQRYRFGIRIGKPRTGYAGC